MSDTQVIFGFLFLAVMLGGMWSSYKIGFKEGTGKMIDFCKTKADKRGCLLYTSPSPRDGLLSRMPSSA